MGHNNHTNYSNFSNNNTNKVNINTSITEVVTEVENEVVTEVENEVVTGVVTGCKRLYVREGATKDSEPLCIIEEASEVVINLENSTDDFYSVCTSSGVEGYCMAKFIEIK